ncbi:hypothetical protein B0H14DRAFT_2647996 [Mycena olivaceomarginata]|nr:hypothetical protein B0H14DRAFT_2647996 [Mycena olivaceomarginata]
MAAAKFGGLGWGAVDRQASGHNRSQQISFIIASGPATFPWDFLERQVWPSQWSKKPKAKKLSKQQIERRRESRRAAQARYRERNHEAVLEAGRERSARRRAHLKTLDPGDEVLEDARAKES